MNGNTSFRISFSDWRRLCIAVREARCAFQFATNVERVADECFSRILTLVFNDFNESR